MRTRIACLGTMLALCAGGAAANTTLTTAITAGLRFSVSFDNSIDGLANAAQVRSAFMTAAQTYADAIGNRATVNIAVSWGSVAGYALPSNALGASVDPLYGYFSYAQVKAYLARNPSATGLTALQALPKTSVDSNYNFVIPSAELKALGLLSATATGRDGSIGFGGNSVSGYSYGPVTAAGTYNFVSVAMHEIAEVLGRTDYIGSSTPYLTPFDLFRFTAAGTNGVSPSALTYFSLDGGKTAQAWFNNVYANGAPYGDRSDWLSSAQPNDVSDAIASPGVTAVLTRSDILALDVIGWNGATSSLSAQSLIGGNPVLLAAITHQEVVPEPGDLALLGVGLFGLAMVRWRRGGAAGLAPGRVPT
jgi:hypothetical protein